MKLKLSNSKNSIILILLVSACLMLFSACQQSTKTLYESDAVRITKSGNITVVTSILTGEEYNLRTVRVRLSEGVSKQYTAIDNDNIKIEIIENGYRVYDKENNAIFTYQRNNRHLRGVSG